MDVFFVFLLLFTEIILLGIAWYLFDGDIISPSIVTLVLFILSTICFAYNTQVWEIVFSFKAYSLFTISFILMILTEKFISKYRITIGKKYKNRTILMDGTKNLLYIPKPIDSILFCFFMLCAIYYVIRVYRTGINLGASGFWTTIGYSKEEGSYDSFSRLLYNMTRLAGYVYIIIFANNVLSCKEKIVKNIKSLLIIIVTLFITFFSGQRSSMICYMFAIIVAVGIALFDKKKSGQKVDMKKFIRRLIMVAVVVIVFFYFTANIVKGTNVQRDVVYYLTYYFGSTTALMGRIVSDPSICHTPFVGYFGEKTFQGFWNSMYSWGIVNEAPADRLWIPMGGIATNAGNEYTFFCGPYIDFGFIGTLIFIVIFYAIFSHIYYWKIKKAPCTLKRYTSWSIYLFLFTLIAMSFYQDTIRSYSRPINILYIMYLFVFCKVFLRIRRQE